MADYMKVPGGKEAHNSGTRAAGRGLKREQNPYTQSQPELRDAWFSGWDDQFNRMRKYSSVENTSPFTNGRLRAEQQIANKFQNATFGRKDFGNSVEVDVRNEKYGQEGVFVEISFASSSDKSVARAEAVVASLQKAITYAKSQK